MEIDMSWQAPAVSREDAVSESRPQIPKSQLHTRDLAFYSREMGISPYFQNSRESQEHL